MRKWITFYKFLKFTFRDERFAEDFDDMIMMLCIISLCLNVEWSFKCKYVEYVKSDWGFLTSAQQWYFRALYSVTISCCLHELDLFRQYEPLYLMPMKTIWTWVREKGMRAEQRKCVLKRVCAVIFGQNIKNTAKQQDSLFCLHHISLKHAYAMSIHSQPISTHVEKSHKPGKSFIHLLC